MAERGDDVPVMLLGLKRDRRGGEEGEGVMPLEVGGFFFLFFFFPCFWVLVLIWFWLRGVFVGRVR